MIRTLAPEMDVAETGGAHAASGGAWKAARLPALRHVIQIEEIGAPGSQVVRGAVGFESVYALGGAAQQQELAQLAKQIQFDDAVNIQFTSGTTGSPKVLNCEFN
jgi:fatty-acyl-CoA synthase